LGRERGGTGDDGSLKVLSSKGRDISFNHLYAPHKPC
jgi:hypothetical protein